MIRGLHGLIYSSDPEGTRAFIRDKLRFPFTDTGEGWLIFDLPEGDLGIHPQESGEPTAGTHNLSFYCDDIQGTVAALKTRGVGFKSEIADHGYGLVTYFSMPGGIEVQLYEPKYVKRKKAAKPKAKRRAAPRAKAAAKRTKSKQR